MVINQYLGGRGRKNMFEVGKGDHHETLSQKE
jgi:hypothetical protein